VQDFFRPTPERKTAQKKRTKAQNSSTKNLKKTAEKF